MKKKNKGFTLMEMMIVVAIIGVLAAIALPSYNRYVLRTNRAAAAAMMLEIAGLLENHHLQHSTYSATFIDSINDSDDYNASPTSGEARYDIDVDRSSTQTYVISATPTEIGGQDADECGTLTLNSFGVKSAIATSGTMNDCW